MKRKFMRVVTLILTVVMLTSVMSVSSFAAKPEKTYKNYAVIGDSIAAAYGLDTYVAGAKAYVENNYDSIQDRLPKYAAKFTQAERDANIYCGEEYYVLDNRLIEGSYADLIADYYGIADENVYTLAHCGFRSVEVRALIDDTYNGDSVMLNSKEPKNCMTSYFANLTESEFNALKSQYVEGIKNSDIITINCASNDVMTYSLFQAGQLDDDASSVEKLAVMEKSMAEGIAKFQVNFTQIIKIIHKLNPNADIYVIGMYNPFDKVTLTNETVLKVGKLVDAAVQSLNLFMSVGCTQAINYRFVDVMGTEVDDVGALLTKTADGFEPMDLGGWQFIKNIHPTKNGHASIAKQVITVANDLISVTQDKVDVAKKDALDKANQIAAVNEKIITDTCSAIKKTHSATKDALYKTAGAVVHAGLGIMPLGK